MMKKIDREVVVAFLAAVLSTLHVYSYYFYVSHFGGKKKSFREKNLFVFYSLTFFSSHIIITYELGDDKKDDNNNKYSYPTSMKLQLLKFKILQTTILFLSRGSNHMIATSHYTVDESLFVILPSDNEPYSLQTSKLIIHLPTNNSRNNNTNDLQKTDSLNGYLAIINGAVTNFRVLVSDEQCTLQRTSIFSKEEDCNYAINGGPYQSYIRGGCIGLVISDGKVIHDDREYQNLNENVGFGVTHDNEWILGAIQLRNNSTTTTKSRRMIEENGIYKKVKVNEFITGLSGWLIKDSKVIPTKIEDQAIYAPRTAIGVNSQGNLIIFQVDGCEKCAFENKYARGLSMYQMAAIMASPRINATYAINMDGGGSSTSVLNGNIINNPTCLDYVDWKCERPVGSAICIHNNLSKA